MNAEQRKELETKGYVTYDHVGDALGMTEDEKELMDIRFTLSRAVKKRREELQLSKKQLAARLGISQSKVTKIEWGDRDISAEEIFSAYLSMNGQAVTERPRSSNGDRNGAKKKAHAK
jgi:predicted XRE-type DNA-binding protein